MVTVCNVSIVLEGMVKEMFFALLSALVIYLKIYA
jgi:hypothetical protein